MRATAAVLLAVALVTWRFPGPQAPNPSSGRWSASPLVATTGVATTFTLTATNEDPLAAVLSSSEIGCVIVTVPATSASPASR